MSVIQAFRPCTVLRFGTVLRHSGQRCFCLRACAAQALHMA